MSDETQHEIEVPVTDTEQAKFEILRQVKGADSYSDLISKILEERVGNIHPDALAEDGVDTDALMASELDPADVPDEYKIGNYDADGTEVSADAE